MRTPEPKIEEALCVGCMNCTVACPRGVLIEPRNEPYRYLPLVKTPNECTACKRCVDACACDAIKISEVLFVSYR